MGALRSVEMEEKYKGYRQSSEWNSGCTLCAEPPLKDFQYWKIINNNFPYDKVSRIHHMIIPKRCVTEKNLTPAETAEFLSLKSSYINQNYGHIIEAVNKGKSIPGHFHLHLLVLDE